MDYSNTTMLIETVRQMNASASTATLLTLPPSLHPKSFNFYSSDQIRANQNSLNNIKYDLSQVKRSARRDFLFRTICKTKSQNIKDRQQRLLLDKPAHHESKWQSSTHLSNVLLKQLNAPADVDASGNIYSPSRDLPRTKEGQKILESEKEENFKPGEVGKIFGEPPIDSCSESCMNMLERHLVSAVERVEREYEAMEWGTVRHSELKGNAGRDLAELKERLLHCVKFKEKLLDNGA